ncbi:MAG: ABC transporter permease [Planctomycetota bacterium]
MTQITQDNVVVEQPRVGRSLWSDAVRRIMQDPAAVACLGVIVLYVVVAIFAAIAWPDWAQYYDYGNINKAPTTEHPLGTDEFGNDVLAKTMLGAKVSVIVGFMSNIIAIPVGMLLGAMAGYYGGKLDDFIVWLFSTLASIPGLIRVIAIKFAFQSIDSFDIAIGGWTIAENVDLAGLPGIILALSISGWIGTCRLVRAETFKLRELDYVLAARASGRGGLSILMRHILPNVVHLGIINFSLGFIGAVKAEVALSYLGIGVTDQPSWGSMISAARMDLIVGRWWQIAAAGTAMFILVLALNIFGDRLRDALDPKLKNL